MKKDRKFFLNLNNISKYINTNVYEKLLHEYLEMKSECSHCMFLIRYVIGRYIEKQYIWPTNTGLSCSHV